MHAAFSTRNRPSMAARMALLGLLALYVLGIGAGSWPHTHDAALAAVPTLREAQPQEKQLPSPVEAEACTLCHVAADTALPTAGDRTAAVATADLPATTVSARPRAGARAALPPARAPPVRV
jgi:hypothetical protein